MASSIRDIHRDDMSIRKSNALRGISCVADDSNVLISGYGTFDYMGKDEGRLENLGK